MTIHLTLLCSVLLTMLAVHEVILESCSTKWYLHDIQITNLFLMGVLGRYRCLGMIICCTLLLVRWALILVCLVAYRHIERQKRLSIQVGTKMERTASVRVPTLPS